MPTTTLDTHFRGMIVMVMGDFFAAGGYYDSSVGSPCFMLTMKAISK